MIILPTMEQAAIKAQWFFLVQVMPTHPQTHPWKAAQFALLQAFLCGPSLVRISPNKHRATASKHLDY